MKEKTEQQRDQTEERRDKKAECCIENKFHAPLLCWKLDSAVRLLACPQPCGACSSAYFTAQTQREKMEEVCVCVCAGRGIWNKFKWHREHQK